MTKIPADLPVDLGLLLHADNIVEYAANKYMKEHPVIEDIKPTTTRNRSNETFLYISPAHKAKLKAYAASTKRTMRAEAELWIDGLKV